ncbi:MAG: c-type cytochrome [Acidobacteriota bacterium]
MSRGLVGLVCWLLGSSLLLAHGRTHWPVPEEAKKRQNPVAATPESIKQGAMLYRGNCQLCHGEKGDGKGPWVEKLPVSPANFTDAEMMRAMTDGEIFWKVSKGRHPMPSFEKQLSERQRWHLVNYLRTFPPGERRASSEAHSH